MGSKKMNFGGFQKTSLIDYPGRISSILFTTGCNLRCPFCYNGRLIIEPKHNLLSEDDALNILESRKRFVTAVVLTGGEPTLDEDLPAFIGRLKKNDFSVKLDTNGFFPNILEICLAQVDYVAMDIKAPKEKYKKYTGIKVDTSLIKESIKILKSSDDLDYEFRTTVAPGLSSEDILKIVEWIAPAKKYFLQEFSVKKEIIDQKIKSLPTLETEDLKKIIKKITPNFVICKLR